MSSISAGTTLTTALVATGDTSGELVLKTGPSATTAVSIDASQNATFVGNVDVQGTLSASGGLPSLNTPLAVVGNSTAGAEIRLPEDTDNGSNYVALKAADSIASNLTFTLPSADGTSGQVLQTNGSGTLSFATAAGTTTTEYTSSTTWTKPSGATWVMVEAWGAGGGGGAGDYGAGGGTMVGGAGGGGGAYMNKLFAASDLTSTVSITIGAGGAGGTIAGGIYAQPGNNGGNTTFGSYLTAYGGAGGQQGQTWNGSTRSWGGSGGGQQSAGTRNATLGNNPTVGAPLLGSQSDPDSSGAITNQVSGGALGSNNSTGYSSTYGGGSGGGGLNDPNPGGGSIYGGAGGGGGGQPTNTGSGGKGGAITVGGGPNGGGRGSAGSNGARFQGGGGGGASGNNTAPSGGGAGGNGGIAGGGGGGGSTNHNNTAGGIGGNGGSGLVRITYW